MKSFVLGSALLLLPGVAYAQTSPPPDPAVAPAPAPPPPAQPPPVAPPKAEPDGVRFRGGISLGGGAFFGGYTSGTSGFSAILGGLDGRLGIQINHYFGIYAQPHLSFGSVNDRGVKGLTGVFAASVIAELTLFHRLFVGVGGGAGVLNNPAGGELHFRLGGYPIMGFGDGARRKGLMVGVDLRLVFLPDPYTVAVMPFFSVGYEAF